MHIEPRARGSAGIRLSGWRPSLAGITCALFTWVALIPSAHAALFQHLTATDPASIDKNASNVVSAWADQSGNANHASASTGSVIYPATNPFPTGTAGLEFGPPSASLQLLDVGDTAGLLDFTGAASTHTGFSVLVSVRVDQLNPSSEPNDLIGVTSVNNAGGFGLRLNSVGRIVAYMGGSVVQRPESDRKVAAGNAVVFAVNYNATTEVLTIWDSLNESEVTATIPKGNFAGSLPLMLGSINNAGRYLLGSVGEVRIHDGMLSPTAFSNERTAMKDRWLKRPMQNLDATLAGSVIGNPVTQWTDQSGNANHASASTGSVSYPSANHFPTGPSGVEFGPTAESLQLLNTANTAGLLDFNGAASTNTGFSLLLSVRVDQLLASGEPNDLIGVTSVNTAGGFGLRLNSVGRIVAYMGGSVVQRPESDMEVAAGNAVVIALNYRAATGVLTIWDSLNESEITATIPKGNFAGTGLPLKLGHLDNSSRHLLGSVGEVKLFAENLSASEFAAQRDAMSVKWLGARPVMPTMPAKPVFTVAQLLNWNPATDADAPFNVATVPLQSRINVPSGLKANANSRIGQGGVQALDTYAGNRPQGGSGSVYTFTYWQYLEESVYWGGISSINIVPPTGEMIDNAHRNGVPILGTVFFPPLVYGGNYNWVRNFLTKVGDTFPAADKLIEMAGYYGFDGWFINQETEGGNAADAATMRDLIRYIRLNSNLKVTWYDSMTESGLIQWQDQFNTNNDWYMRHNYSTGQQNNTGALIADSIFIDFSNDPSTLLTSNSRSHAQTLALDPYKVWTGIEAEAEDFRSSTAARIKMSKIFPDGANHITSVGIYKPLKYATQLADQDLFWTGPSGDPRDTSGTVGTGAWRGVAHNIAERSAITSLPFATHFCIGRGSNFYNHGAIVKPGAWWNRALQSILPTWRWIVTSTGTKLAPELWSGDSYRGGGCLRVSGRLDATNTLRLFLTELPATANTRLKITFKREGLSGVDSLMQVGVGTLGSPFTFYPVGACAIDGWNQTTINLSAHAGTNLTALALRFDSGTTVDPYEIRIGEIVIYDDTAPAPEPPANIQALDVVGWNGVVSGRVKWDHALVEHYAYHVYVRLTDGSLVFVGSTPSNYFYFENIPISADYSSVVVQTIGPDAKESRLSDAGNYSTWAVSQGIPGAPASGDFDQDGISNLMEYALGMDPKAASPPAGVLSGSGITYIKGAEAIANGDVSWVIESSQTLAPDSWIPQVSQAAGNPSPTISHTFLPGSLTKDFFRLRVTSMP
jgi:endo-beta-N-acetylglucosaminidase D